MPTPAIGPSNCGSRSRTSRRRRRSRAPPGRWAWCPTRTRRSWSSRPAACVSVVGRPPRASAQAGAVGDADPDRDRDTPPRPRHRQRRPRPPRRRATTRHRRRPPSRSLVPDAATTTAAARPRNRASAAAGRPAARPSARVGRRGPVPSAARSAQRQRRAASCGSGRLNNRLTTGFAAVCLLLTVIVGRLIQVQGLDHSGYANAAAEQRANTITLNALRGADRRPLRHRAGVHDRRAGHHRRPASRSIRPTGRPMRPSWRRWSTSRPPPSRRSVPSRASTPCWPRRCRR